ncbi:MAG: Zn-dependent hydrolase, glyoxylase [Acidimicrobiales bacterium]|nr:Zn-dependent hydrolase, glyoxylase [Acidimicrobiales bacterium]
MSELTALAQGVFAWLQRPSRLGVPNAGVVLDVDGATVIDTLTVASQFDPFGDAVEALGFPVRRIVLSGDHLDFVGGTVRFKTAAVYGSPSASAHLDQPPNPPVLRALHPDLADEIDDELQTRPVTHIVAEATDLTPATVVVPLDGQSALNLVVVVPDADVLFGGALCCFGVTPLAFDGDPVAWAESLDALADLATTIVPGHGPVGGVDELRAQQAYLQACVDASGDPSRIPSGPWDAWPGREWDAVNVERAAMLAAGDPTPPPSMLRAVGLA